MDSDEEKELIHDLLDMATDAKFLHPKVREYVHELEGEIRHHSRLDSLTADRMNALILGAKPTSIEQFNATLARDYQNHMVDTLNRIHSVSTKHASTLITRRYEQQATEKTVSTVDFETDPPDELRKLPEDE